MKFVNCFCVHDKLVMAFGIDAEAPLIVVQPTEDRSIVPFIYALDDPRAEYLAQKIGRQIYCHLPAGSGAIHLERAAFGDFSEEERTFYLQPLEKSRHILLHFVVSKNNMLFGFSLDSFGYAEIECGLKRASYKKNILAWTMETWVFEKSSISFYIVIEKEQRLGFSVKPDYSFGIITPQDDMPEQKLPSVGPRIDYVNLVEKAEVFASKTGATGCKVADAKIAEKLKDLDCHDLDKKVAAKVEEEMRRNPILGQQDFLNMYSYGLRKSPYDRGWYICESCSGPVIFFHVNEDLADAFSSNLPIRTVDIDELADIVLNRLVEFNNYCNRLDKLTTLMRKVASKP